MKNLKYGLVVLCMLLIFFATSCSIKKDDLEGATIYTTVYPINYIAKYLYEDYGQISSIYPTNTDINTYKLTNKQIKNYASGDLFIYNGLTKEKEIAKDFLNKNNDLILIDAAYRVPDGTLPEALWLSPDNYLMLATNIKDNLSENLTSKTIIDAIEVKYKDFQEKTSLMGATLHTIGKTAKENGKNIIVTSNNMFKYLENYGFNIISLQDEANLKETRLANIKSNFKSGKYKYILVADVDANNEVIQDLITNHKATNITVDTLTMTLTGDYFDIMNKYIENIKTIVS